MFNLQIFNLAMLIAAIIALGAINRIDDNVGGAYEDAGNYRAAAGCLIAFGCMALPFHIIMIIVRCLYTHSAVEKYFISYVIIVS